jgi:hypothetical protein
MEPAVAQYGGAGLRVLPIPLHLWLRY